jgi:hypothetical protein
MLPRTRPYTKERYISETIKVRLYKTVIRPNVAYGAETWTLTEKMVKLLMTWERKVLRKIYGPTKENGCWRIKMYHEIREKFKSPDIISVIKLRRLEWLGHVMRMNETRVRKRSWMTNQEEKGGEGDLDADGWMTWRRS